MNIIKNYNCLNSKFKWVTIDHKMKTIKTIRKVKIKDPLQLSRMKIDEINLIKIIMLNNKIMWQGNKSMERINQKQNLKEFNVVC